MNCPTCGQEIPEDEIPIEPPQMTLREKAIQIYDAYPRKVGRPMALKVIMKAVQNGVPWDDLFDRTKKYAQALQGSDPQFTPHPATWYNREGWNDPLPTRTERKTVGQLSIQLKVIEEEIASEKCKNPDDVNWNKVKELRVKLKQIRQEIVSL
jgi:hypothetical protein